MCASAALAAFLLNALPTKADSWVADVSTAYNRIVVTEDNTGDRKRAVWLNPFGIQSEMYIDGEGHADESRLVAPYQKAIDIFVAALFPHGPSRSLFLGGCVGALPRYFLRQYPKMATDVVEIDPGMTKVAQNYFSFDGSSFPTLSLIYEDARNFANEDHRTYEFVFIDAFGSGGRVPFQLVTEEMFARLAYETGSDGTILMNVIGSYEGGGASIPRRS